MSVAHDTIRLTSLHGYGTREGICAAGKDVKAVFLLEKWPKFFRLIKIQYSAVTEKENP